MHVRSFADGNGDGIGDVEGLRSKRSYLADERNIDPAFGTLEQAENMIGDAHQLGIRVIIDLDWNPPGIRSECTSTLRFWLDRGTDGFRVDVAHGMAKDMSNHDVMHHTTRFGLPADANWRTWGALPYPCRQGRYCLLRSPVSPAPCFATAVWLRPS